MPNSQTPNYGLSQWSKSDRVQMEDFNADNAKIDAAIKAVEALAGGKADSSALDALSRTVSGHTAALAGKGNCQVYATSYTGTGKYGQGNQNSLTFPARPMVVFLGAPNGAWGALIQGQAQGCSTSVTGGGALFYITWSGNTVHWYNHMSDNGQMNSSGTTYHVVALLAK